MSADFTKVQADEMSVFLVEFFVSLLEEMKNCLNMREVYIRLLIAGAEPKENAHYYINVIADLYSETQESRIRDSAKGLFIVNPKFRRIVIDQPHHLSFDFVA